MTVAPIQRSTASTEAANRLNSVPQAIRCTETGPEEDTTMTNEISPVARCTCRHLYSVHDGPCQSPWARGICKCPAFDPDLFQPHTDTLEVLQASIRLWGFAPTVRELAATLGLSSTATVNSRLAVLEDAGLIERVGPRAIRLIERTS